MELGAIFYIILQWLSAITEIFISYCFVNLLMNKDNSFLKQHTMYIVICCVSLGTVLTYNRYYTGLLSWLMIIIQSILVLLTIWYKDKNATPYFCIILAVTECFAFLQLFFAFIFNIAISNITIPKLYFDNTIYRTSCYVGTAILLSFVYFILSEYKKINEFNVYLYLSSYLLYDIAGLCAIIVCQYQLLVYSANKNANTLLLLLMFLCTASFLLLASIKRSEIQLKVNTLELKAELLEENYKEIEAIYQNFAYTYHDIKNHFIIIQNYCIEGKNDKAVQYIEKIQKPLKEVRRYINSGNEIIDIILNFKLFNAEKQDIRIETHIDSNLKEIGLEDDDICALFSNLLDNSIEACQLMPKKERYIVLIVKELGDEKIIKIINSCLESNKKSYMLMNKKHNNSIHGYGLKSVEAKVKKYGGRLEKEKRGGSFIVTIKFFRSQKKEE